MRKWLNKYFVVSRTEFNGLTILWVLIVIVTLLPAVLSWLLPEKKDNYKTENIVADSDILLKRTMMWKHKNTISRMKDDGELFKFDPNTLNAAGWERLGLSPKQAAAILNYRAKGGKFRVAEDVKKMYTIKPSLYARISPYIQIETIEPGISKSYRKHHVEILRVIELNSADTTELVEINGVGSTFAKRIFKYREQLGGFYTKQQLKEVFGLDSLKYQEISEQVKVDPAYLRKIMINTISLELLKNHPYLKYKQANAIIQYRKQHGNYSNIADLNKVAILSTETIDKIAPYLSFEL
ncbi:ComEA family DNA-binding protein [Pedobacter duraquae]|uniref:DNA uptake protein ComE-like DNA-binding protein n=1 Tax=Pedobacter duraquae TaxID=425511 RepID=A0A4V3C3G3_9SPHI|nr:helix-hairpin-helix domain-containing protein [Pedobacter duraquae]TDO21988.1 DNA uptake protein ComE-like DNA-binding protein [Pedobacter duraquae]